MANQCEMTIGFLVPHRCEHPALGHCIQCGRGYCEEHISVGSAGLVCQACQQGLEQPVVLPTAARSFSSRDIRAFDAASDDDTIDDMFSDLS